MKQKPDWEETTHSDAGKNGHRTFENKETGEKLRHDQEKSQENQGMMDMIIGID